MPLIFKIDFSDFGRGAQRLHQRRQRLPDNYQAWLRGSAELYRDAIRANLARPGWRYPQPTNYTMNLSNSYGIAAGKGWAGIKLYPRGEAGRYAASIESGSRPNPKAPIGKIVEWAMNKLAVGKEVGRAIAFSIRKRGTKGTQIVAVTLRNNLLRKERAEAAKEMLRRTFGAK